MSDLIKLSQLIIASLQGYIPANVFWSTVQTETDALWWIIKVSFSLIWLSITGIIFFHTIKKIKQEWG